MKVLYIGHYKEFGGWANAAQEHILALDHVGVNVVCRNVTLTQDKQDVHPKLLEFEKRDAQDVDYCIQHVLPHHLIGTENFKKNVAFVELETTSIQHLNWLVHLQKMDEVWTANQDSKTNLEKDDLRIPVQVVHHTCDISKYTQPYPNVPIPGTEGKFIFYYIGDLNDRKNLECIANCFHSEFDRTDSVAMLFKVKKFGHTSPQVNQLMDDMLTGVKKSLRMYSDLNEHIKDIVISEELTNEQIYSIHQTGHCFVLCSHGEAWSIPAFSAMSMGNTPLCSNVGGPKEFIGDSMTGSLIPGVFSVCKCSDAAFPDMFTGRELWFNPCEMTLKQQMRARYENWLQDPMNYKNQNKVAGLERAQDFSYGVIGERMKDLLGSYCNRGSKLYRRPRDFKLQQLEEK